MKGTTKTVPLSMLRRHSVRQRQRSREQLIALAESWLTMPVHPILVRESAEPGMYDVADGNSRVDGLELLGETEAEVSVADENLSDEELDDIGFISSFHREGLSCSDQGIIVSRKLAAGVSNQAIAKKLNINEGWASKLGKFADLCEKAQQAALDGKIGPNEWAMLAKLDAAGQVVALSAAINGNRDALKQAVKLGLGEATPPDKKPPAEKTARVQIPLAVATKKYQAAGVVSIASLPGQQIDYDAMRNLLNEALNAVNYAITEKLDIKTFQAAMKSKAAAAGAVASPESAVSA